MIISEILQLYRRESVTLPLEMVFASPELFNEHGPNSTPGEAVRVSGCNHER
jgi:hypothetical protein